MWRTVELIGSGFTLAAFVTAAITSVLKARLRKEEKLIRTALPRDRAKLVESSLEFFRVETKGLTQQQRFDIAIEQVRARARRFAITSAVILVLALVAAAVTVYAIYENHDEPRKAASDTMLALSPAPKKPYAVLRGADPGELQRVKNTGATFESNFGVQRADLDLGPFSSDTDVWLEATNSVERAFEGGFAGAKILHGEESLAEKQVNGTANVTCTVTVKVRIHAGYEPHFIAEGWDWHAFAKQLTFSAYHTSTGH